MSDIIKISPSILSADFSKLGDEVISLEEKPTPMETSGEEPGKDDTKDVVPWRPLVKLQFSPVHRLC